MSATEPAKEPFAAVLCKWMPSALDAETISREFGALLVRLGIEIDGDSKITVRTPEERRAMAHDPNYAVFHKEWHGEHRPFALVFWGDKKLPRVHGPDGEELETKPGDVVMVLNQIARHATPEDADGWLTQGWVSYAEQVRLERAA